MVPSKEKIANMMIDKLGSDKDDHDEDYEFDEVKKPQPS
jgi:hypothetical protein